MISSELAFGGLVALLQIATSPCANLSTWCIGLICSHGQVYIVGERIEAHRFLDSFPMLKDMGQMYNEITFKFAAHLHIIASCIQIDASGPKSGSLSCLNFTSIL